MARVDLMVPFEQKDEAKKRGARWDNQKKTWYIPEGVAHEPFGRWLPNFPDINVRARVYYILESKRSCWCCDNPTCVVAIVLPDEHEELEEADESNEDLEFESEEDYEAWLKSPVPLEWCTADMMSRIQYISYLPSSVDAKIKELTSNFFVDFSKTTSSYYWMNHCERCGAKQGDNSLHCGSGGPFSPVSTEDAALITVHQVNEPFEAGCGGFTSDVEFFNAMRHKDPLLLAPAEVLQIFIEVSAAVFNSGLYPSEHGLIFHEKFGEMLANYFLKRNVHEEPLNLCAYFLCHYGSITALMRFVHEVEGNGHSTPYDFENNSNYEDDYGFGRDRNHKYYDFMMSIDVGEIARFCKSLGWEAKWCPFDERYLTLWNEGFNEPLPTPPLQ